jgi:hypothetical protein
VVETMMNLVYLYTAHVTAWPPAPLVGFTAAAITLSKTLLYWAQEYFCNFCAVEHNSLEDLIKYYVLTSRCVVSYRPKHAHTLSTPWVIVPALVVVRLGKDLIADLNLAHQVSVKAASGKSS